MIFQTAYLIDLSQIPIWWNHQKFKTIFWKQFLPHGIGNDLKSENGVKSFMQIKFFAFLEETFQFSKVYENEPKHGKC